MKRTHLDGELKAKGMIIESTWRGRDSGVWLRLFDGDGGELVGEISGADVPEVADIEVGQFQHAAVGADDGGGGINENRFAAYDIDLDGFGGVKADGSLKY